MFSIDYIKEWSESYKTDLTTNIMPFVLILAIAAGAIVGVVVYKKKKK